MLIFEYLDQNTAVENKVGYILAWLQPNHVCLVLEIPKYLSVSSNKQTFLPQPIAPSNSNSCRLKLCVIMQITATDMLLSCEKLWRVSQKVAIILGVRL